MSIDINFYNLINKLDNDFYYENYCLYKKKNLLKSKSLLLTSENEKKLLENTFVNTKKIKKTVIHYGINKTKFSKKKCLKSFYKD